MTKKYHEQKREHEHEREIRPHSVLVMDEIQTNLIRTPDFRFLVINGRCVGTTAFLALQHLLDLPPAIRCNLDYVFIGRETKLATKQKLYNFYASGVFSTFNIFSQVLDICTVGYGYLVIDNTTSSSRLEDQIFWYQAPATIPNFKIG